MVAHDPEMGSPGHVAGHGSAPGQWTSWQTDGTAVASDGWTLRTHWVVVLRVVVGGGWIAVVIAEFSRISNQKFNFLVHFCYWKVTIRHHFVLRDENESKLKSRSKMSQNFVVFTSRFVQIYKT